MRRRTDRWVRRLAQPLDEESRCGESANFDGRGGAGLLPSKRAKDKVTPMKVELKDRTFGELVGQSFSLAVSHFYKLFAMVYLFNLPVWVLKYWITTAGNQAATPEQVVLVATVGSLLFLFISLIVTPLASGACTLLVASSFTDDNPTVLDCLRLAFSRFGQLLGAAMMTGLVVGLGAMLFVVPGFVFMTWYFVTTPALMVERLGVQLAMARSKHLTDGNRWSVLGFFLVTTFIVMVVYGATKAVVEDHISNPLLSLVLQSVIGAAIDALGVVAPVVYYFNIRVRKEAFDVEALSQIVEAIGERGAARK